MADELTAQNPEENKQDKRDYKDPSDEAIIPEDIQTIIEDPEIPQAKRDRIIKAFIRITSIRQASSFSGPIPPPQILKGYNEVVKDGAERIVIMAEKQSNHRMQLEDHAIKEELKQSRLGQIFGFILGLVGFGLATTLAMFGHEAIAGIFGTTTILGLVTVFVLGKKAQQKDLSNKSE
ncbi:MAG: DUF2335 domain-containing protein [Sphingobacteriales bacterium]|nr:MAG: DUF2335 domain-containing protein [Sphingobacteriales bacterium]